MSQKFSYKFVNNDVTFDVFFSVDGLPLLGIGLLKWPSNHDLARPGASDSSRHFYVIRPLCGCHSSTSPTFISPTSYMQCPANCHFSFAIHWTMSVTLVYWGSHHFWFDVSKICNLTFTYHILVLTSHAFSNSPGWKFLAEGMKASGIATRIDTGQTRIARSLAFLARLVLARGAVMPEYRSQASAHRDRIDAVQQRTSNVLQNAHIFQSTKIKGCWEYFYLHKLLRTSPIVPS